MTLEQRIEVLERAVKALIGGDFTVVDGQVFIQKAFIQEGTVTAASISAAEHRINTGFDYDAERDRKMDLIMNSMRGSQALSRL